ncbi:hypothetical protein Ciccas_003226 [Cichlidogyrus casuarinus]|uniref:Bystin n=1 Tax=Cichlidogyrus casuarinus TaxID=1844966 RepID=A0ABD2QFN5_9PLAT
MPKRRRAASSEIQVLGEKDIKKIQRLVNLVDKDEQEPGASKAPNKLVVELEEDSNELKNAFYDDDAQLSKGVEWSKFFSTDLTTDFNDKLVECKDLVEEEMSEFCGSLPGDIDNTMEKFEDLPEELQRHIRLLTSVLRNYRSGPLPKTVKVLPSLPGWDGLLETLDPMSWTPHAHMKVTKVFASRGHEPSLHYYQNYLLPKVQEDIAATKRLCLHLFEALISSMFRPQEFIAGIFLPWVRSDMSKTEGIVLAHLLRKASLKVRFGTVCLALVCKEDFSIARSLVVEALLEKKYKMPETAISVLVDYFCSMDRECNQFFNDEGRLPVSWFKSLSTFLELYRDAVIPEERERLVKLCHRHQHPFFTKQIRGFIQLIPTEPKN